MAETLLLASKALFAAVGCWLGLHLMQRARLAGGVPLYAWASAMICVGGIGLIGFAVGPLLAERSLPLARWLMIGSDALERLSLLGLAVFIWRVFGAAGGVHMVLLGALLVAMTSTWTLVIVVQRWPEPMLSLPVQLASQLSFATPFVWSTLEAAVLYRRTRRVVDPLEAHRTLLWALGSTSFALICVASALVLALPAGSAFGPALSVLRALLYTLLSAIVLLAFVPPAAYVRWLRAARSSPARPRGSASAGRSARRQRQPLAPASALVRARGVV